MALPLIGPLLGTHFQQPVTGLEIKMGIYGQFKRMANSYFRDSGKCSFSFSVHVKHYKT